MNIQIGTKVRYNSFGFIPNGHFSNDLWGWIFGHRNLLKRLQARDIMAYLEIQPRDVVLDFGCGAGYFTVEMAKLASQAYGIDINPYINTIRIPSILQGKLKFIQISGTRLPFADGFFDRVLASEILPMIADPNDFLREIRRILKLGGRLVISNGAGHPGIRRAIARRSFFIRWAERLYPERFPKSYEEYCAILQKTFGTGRKDFLEEEDVRLLLKTNGFQIRKVGYTPGHWAGAYISWSQFILYLRTGQTLSQKNFPLNFLFWSLLRPFERETHKGGLLCAAERI
jgi:ubiquinone/menaquinone biosynthesis C-methylase UbiE